MPTPRRPESPPDPYGSYVVSLKPGLHEFVVSEHRARFWNLGGVAVPPADSLQLHLPSGASLSGQAMTAEGAPVEHGLVALVGDLEKPINLDQWGFSFAAAVLTGAEGRYEIAVRSGTYDVAVFPERHTGVGAVLKGVALSGDRTQHLVLPAMEVAHRLYGEIRDEPEVWRGEITLQFYDEDTNVLAQATSGAQRGYSIHLPPGQYRVRAGLTGPVGGFQRIYGVGTVPVERDLQWDIELSSEVTAVEAAGANRPPDYVLGQNFNPFNPSTVIRYQLPESARVELAIYNLLGQKVATIVDEVREAGTHVARWDGRDEEGREVATGVYLYRLTAGSYQRTRRLVLLR